ncbi:hypothetical protein PI124_g22446 [Phytophthora idaei]|nr:hypothetical protein PI124_g22446 [Phytophthora idaei]
MLINKVSPAIRAVCPGCKRRYIRVQHDNASPHAAAARPIVLQAAKENGWDIRMEFQPPNHLI